MSRHPRSWSASGFYHVVARGNNRNPIFRHDTDRSRYLQFLAMALASHRVQLFHYCLMSNHVHLLFQTPTPTALSQTMHELQRRYWFHVRREYKISGHLWQGRYHSFPIEEDSYLLECGRYIERNPLPAQMVTELALYPWSSYLYYAYGKEREVDLSISPGYLAMGTTPSVRQEAYRTYVTTTRPYDIAMTKQLTEAIGV